MQKIVNNTKGLQNSLNVNVINNSTISISIIVAIHNSECYLHACLESLMNQPESVIEILCIDDGSTDTSQNILTFYQKKDTRIQIIHIDHSGVGIARNTGLYLAKGNLVTFVDSDDVLPPKALENLLEIYDPKLDLIAGTCVHLEPPHREYSIGKLTPRDIPIQCAHYTDSLFQLCSTHIHGKLFNKTIIKENNISFPSSKLGEDGAFLFHYLACCRFIYFSSTIVYNYRKNVLNSLSSQRLHFGFIESLLFLKGQLVASQKYGLYKKTFSNAMLDQTFVNIKYYKKQLKSKFLKNYWKELLPKFIWSSKNRKFKSIKIFFGYT